jgi:hypothetical protein
MSITARSHHALKVDFIVDSGASDVSIPADVVLTLIRTGTIKKATSSELMDRLRSSIAPNGALSGIYLRYWTIACRSKDLMHGI